MKAFASAALIIWVSIFFRGLANAPLWLCLAWIASVLWGWLMWRAEKAKAPVLVGGEGE